MHIVVALAIGILGTAYAIRYTVVVGRSGVTGTPASAAQVLAGLHDGAVVEVHGLVEGAPLRSPISDTPCAWWRVLVVDVGQPTTRTGGVRLDRTSRSPLSVDDGTGVVLVDVACSTGAGQVASSLQERGDVGRRIVIEDEVHQLPGRDEWRTHTEHVITSGTRIWAAGQARHGRLVGDADHPVVVTTTPPDQRSGQRRRNLLLGVAAIIACPLLGLATYALGG